MPRTLTTALLLTLAASMALAADSKTPAAKAPASASKAPAPKTTPATPAAAPSPAATQSPAASPEAPAAEVVLKTTEPIHVLALSMKGAYMQHGDAFMQLASQLGAQGKEPLGPPFGRYFNNMHQVAESELSWEVCFPVDASVKATAPAELKDVPGGLHATVVHKGSPEKLEAAWTSILSWVPANGYAATGPLAMFFLSEPDPSDMQVELRVPVAKLK